MLSPNGCFAAAGVFYAGNAGYGHEFRYSGREIAAVIVARHLINVRSVGYVGESLLVLCGVSRRLSVALHEEASRVEEVCRCVELERGRLCVVYAAVSSRHAQCGSDIEVACGVSRLHEASVAHEQVAERRRSLSGLVARHAYHALSAYALHSSPVSLVCLYRYGRCELEVAALSRGKLLNASFRNKRHVASVGIALVYSERSRELRRTLRREERHARNLCTYIGAEVARRVAVGKLHGLAVAVGSDDVAAEYVGARECSLRAPRELHRVAVNRRLHRLHFVRRHHYSSRNRVRKS